eukprot:IDg20132t1
MCNPELLPIDTTTSSTTCVHNSRPGGQTT